MSDTPALLRKAADLLEVTPIAARQEEAAELIAFHLLRMLGDDGHEAEEAKLLCRMLDEG